MGINPVATYTPSNNTTQLASAYKAALDGNSIVAERIVDCFAARQTTVPAMTITLDPGYVIKGTTLTEVTAQTSGTITAPSGNPRIDRAVVDRFTGVLTIVTGTPAGSPAPPAIPSGKIPIAQILLQTSSSSITNSMITDERALQGLGRGLVGEENFGAWTQDDGSGNLTLKVNATLKDDGSGNLTTRFFTQANLASTSTTDLGTAASSIINITGTTTISALGSTASTASPLYFLTFAASLTLTYNATSLILPGAANITTAAGDTAVALYLGSGNWKILSYTLANGMALVGGVTFAVKSDQTTGTSTSVAVNPGVQQYHNSACKAWCKTQYSGATPSAAASYNISSVSANSTGNLTYNFTTSFNSANYAIIGSGFLYSGTVSIAVLEYQVSTSTASSCQILICNSGNTVPLNSNHSVSFFGGQ